MKTAKQFVSLDAAWKEYWGLRLRNITPEMKRQLIKTFYSGALASYSIVLEAVTDKDATPESVAAALDSLRDEFSAFHSMHIMEEPLQ